MPPSDPTPRRYTEKEVGLILRRATELQRTEPSARDQSDLTLAELEEIAVEAGIDPHLLRRAARDLEYQGPTTFGGRLAGVPLVIQLERVVAGEYPAEHLDELIPVIQVATDGQGHASAVGKTLTWNSRSDSKLSSQQVLVSANNGETLIRIEERYSELAGALFGGIMAGVGGGAGLGVGGALAGTLGSVALGVLFPLIFIPGSYFMARAILAAKVAKRRRAAEGLMEELVERVRHQVEGALPPGA
ncbi:MAG: hypothetical protein V3R71_00455 [Gemmatimonadales bacterium]